MSPMIKVFGAIGRVRMRAPCNANAPLIFNPTGDPMLTRRHTLLSLSAAAALGSPGLLMAQATRNLRLTVGFPPGDMADIISRSTSSG